MHKRMKKWFGIVSVAFVLLLCSGCSLATFIPFEEVTADESVFEERFYYSQLSEEEKLTYREIYQGIMDHQEEIYVHGTDPELVNSILNCVIYDFAEIFWTDGTGMSNSFELGFTIVEIEYQYSLEERTAKEADIKTATTDILSQLSALTDEYEKIKMAYEYLVNTVEYVDGVKDDQNLYSALVGKQTVCAGYARANQYLLNQSGVYCAYVLGTATNEDGSEAHAWNIVECNEKYYYVDVTWADPIPEEETPVLQRDMIYDYLCCDENLLSSTHVIQEGYDYPACDSGDLNYYKLHGMYYETVDKKQLLNDMKEDINSQANSTIFKFASADLYTQAKGLLMDGLMNEAAGYLCERYDLWEVEYNYEEADTTNKFIVYWQYE